MNDGSDEGADRIVDTQDTQESSRSGAANPDDDSDGGNNNTNTNTSVALDRSTINNTSVLDASVLTLRTSNVGAVGEAGLAAAPMPMPIPTMPVMRAAYPSISPRSASDVPSEAMTALIPNDEFIDEPLDEQQEEQKQERGREQLHVVPIYSVTKETCKKNDDNYLNKKTLGMMGRSNTSPTSVTLAATLSDNSFTDSNTAVDDEWDDNNAAAYAVLREKLRTQRRRKCLLGAVLVAAIGICMTVWASSGEGFDNLDGHINFIDETMQPTTSPANVAGKFTYVQNVRGPVAQGCEGRVTRTLDKPIVADSVRIKVTSFVNWPSLRVGFVDSDGQSIEVASVSSSSVFDDLTCAATNAAITPDNECENTWWSWCAQSNRKGDHVDFSFGKFVTIQSIVFEGRYKGLTWGYVKSMKVFATLPTSKPTQYPTMQPTALPTEIPTLPPQPQQPTNAPKPTMSPTTTEYGTRYIPGQLSHTKLGVTLSTGLDIAIVAKKFNKVQLADGGVSQDLFHDRPDYGATFALSQNDTENPGGWIYVSNSELEDAKGGVGAVTFNADGTPVKYEMLQKGTERNCGGGKTPWDTYISCEEPRIGRVGQCWEIDPRSNKKPRKTVLGRSGGIFESFSYDVRDKEKPAFFVTEDFEYGALRRFIPNNPDWENPRNMLHGEGTFDYLVLHPDKKNGTVAGGTFEWVAQPKLAKQSAFAHYRNSEGIDAYDGELYFVSKRFRMLYILDLDHGTYTQQHTENGRFDGDPDQMQRLIGDNGKDEHGIVYFTESGGDDAGIHGRDGQGRYFTILESPVYKEETTGLAFSPDHRHMYLAYQMNGILFDVWRKDGLPFTGKTFNLQYHKEEAAGW
mmetsp:Transcript_6853/g.14963  ORF Transcript_6853/g.14963 Transcript_6853/m.14963 type:complete len:854 (+) Transcript_6853:200-2761(+)